MQTHASGNRQRHERQAKALGLFSLALGASELLAPEQVAHLIGVKDNRSSRLTLRALGVREILSGLAILAQGGRSAGPLWARVAGDAVDLALMGRGFASNPVEPARLAVATAAVLGATALDVYAAASLSRNETIQKVALPVHVVRSVTINRSPELVYQFWRNLENLPRFMAHLESVEDQGESSVWRAKAPAGTSIEWRAEITEDRPGETIAWRSLEGATVPNRGAVCFKTAPGQRGTELVVELKYEPPGGALGAAVAKLFGEEPGQQIASDLRRLKQVLETGSVVRSDASIHRGPHPARPPAATENETMLGSEV
ncbi:MAG TPA: SRPBCC family protein [Polyangiaceae bacterium]|nr:SRPBCC family protein [Polyangiaceae bacterium]